MDVVWKDENKIWAMGGSNTMYVSKDNGKNFVFDKSTNDRSSECLAMLVERSGAANICSSTWVGPVIMKK